MFSAQFEMIVITISRWFLFINRCSNYYTADRYDSLRRSLCDIRRDHAILVLAGNLSELRLLSDMIRLQETILGFQI